MRPRRTFGLHGHGRLVRYPISRRVRCHPEVRHSHVVVGRNPNLPFLLAKLHADPPSPKSRLNMMLWFSTNMIIVLFDSLCYLC
jgi:hypothetical protein